VVGVSLFVPCEEAMVVSPSDSEPLVAPGLVSLFVPCEESIVMSSSGSGSVGRSVYLAGFCIGVAFVSVLISCLREFLCRHFCIRY
jgi:hypothetical protein